MVETIWQDIEFDYWARIVLLIVLGTIAVYRREMSCNHVYNNDENEYSPMMSIEEEDEEEKEKSREKEVNSQGWTNFLLGIWAMVSIVECKNSYPPSYYGTATPEECAEAILEGAGHFCSGQPIWTFILHLLALMGMASPPTNWRQQRATRSTANRRLKNHTHKSNKNTNNTASSRHETFSHQSNGMTEIATSTLTHEVPPDLQVQILSFLHPRDVVNFATVNTACKDLVDGSPDNNNNDTHLHLWKTLFDRDYAWLVHSWDVGRKARETSLARIKTTTSKKHVPINKRFYFEFAYAHVNYLVAGYNSLQRCLVGLYGNIYDITNFVEHHPGTLESLLVQSGRDATRFFHDVGHSTHARKLAREYCVAVRNDCGVHPPSSCTATLSMRQSKKQRQPWSFVHRLEREKRVFEQRARRKLPFWDSDILSELHVYYDPYQQQWKLWYINGDLENIFVHDLDKI